MSSRGHLAVLRFGVVRVPAGRGYPRRGGRGLHPELQPEDYIDVDWLRLLRLAPTAGRGFAGILRGDAVEDAYRTARRHDAR